MQLRLVARLERDRLVLRLLGGARHSEVPVAAEDPVDVLTAYEAPTTPARALWSLTQLDAALHREGYTRTGPWREGTTADITRTG